MKMTHSIIHDFVDGSFIKICKQSEKKYVLTVVDADSKVADIFLSVDEIVVLQKSIESILQQKV
jgi:hypothetical protein